MSPCALPGTKRERFHWIWATNGCWKVWPLGGMSGGGVFDRDARPIGIIVRGSEAEEPYRIVRASKLEPLRERLLERMQSVADWE